MLLAATVVTAAAPQRLSAQTKFAGTVIRLVGADTAVVPNAVVQLHRVSTVAQGVIDSGRTTARGGWRFRTRLETGASYLVSARFAGIQFFTPPLSIDPAHPDTGVRILVADTSSGPAARVTVGSRHLLVQGGDSAGWRGILDVVVLENRSGYTRIAPDTTRPAYVMLLPPGAHEPELADGDIGPEAVRFREGSLEIYSPLAPGEMSLTVQYLLPAEHNVGIPFGDTVATFNLLIDGEGTTTAGPRLDGPTPTELEGRSFRRWSGPVPGGTVLQLDLRAARKTPTWLLVALVVALATGLVTALVVARRRPGLAKRVGVS
ncbi:MAG: hypothetical protein ABJB33_10230 [Gemmatimonadota bacterium]